MNFFSSDSKKLVSEDVRTAFNRLVQEEVDLRDPAEGSELLYNDEPEQLQFNFMFSNQK